MKISAGAHARIAAAWLAVAAWATPTARAAADPASPALVKREDAARLVILLREETVDRTWASSLSRAASAIELALRDGGFQVTRDAGVTSSVKVTVGYPTASRKHGVAVSIEARGVVVDRFDAPGRTNLFGSYPLDDEFAAGLGRLTRERLERSERVAAVAAELGAGPAQAGPVDAAVRRWSQTAAAPAVRRRLAVLEFRGALGPDVRALLTDQARSAALEAVRGQGVSVMTRENTAVMLKDQGKDAACTEGECEVETARLIGAHLLVTGEVVLVSGVHFLQLKLFDAESGALLASQQVGAADDLALVKAAKPAAAALFE
jgi:hypothetical protein